MLSDKNKLRLTYAAFNVIMAFLFLLCLGAAFAFGPRVFLIAAGVGLPLLAFFFFRDNPKRKS